MLPALRVPHELVVVQSGQLISDDISEVISRISQKFVSYWLHMQTRMTRRKAPSGHQYDDSYLGKPPSPSPLPLQRDVVIYSSGGAMAAYFGNAVAATDVNKDGGVVPDCHGVTQNGSGSSSVTSPALVLVETPNEPVCGGTVVSTKMNGLPSLVQKAWCPSTSTPTAPSAGTVIVDLLVGAPLFMERGSDGKLREVGQVYVYLGKGGFSFSPPSKLTGSEIYARYGSAISVLGDLDMDGFNDVAIAAPYGGPSRQGLVYIHNGRPLRAPIPQQPSQVLEGKWASTSMPPSFGYSMHGATDIDQNGYPDLVVGVFGADKAVLYRARPVISVNATLDISPQILSPEEKKCQLPGTSTMVSCFMVKYCLKASGKGAPSTL
ncbi:hypothetical protein NFI96_008629, partial [Prochilodus magdalenae]